VSEKNGLSSMLAGSPPSSSDWLGIVPTAAGASLTGMTVTSTEADAMPPLPSSTA